MSRFGLMVGFDGNLLIHWDGLKAKRVNGRFLLYRKTVTPSADGEEIEFGEREIVYNVNDHGLEHRHLGDVSKDGRRYLVAQRVDFERNRNRSVIFIQDWLADFKSERGGRR